MSSVNYTGGDLLYELNTRMALMDAAQRELTKYTEEKAQTERDYRVALADCMNRLRADKGTPATILGDIARGQRSIADLKFKRDIATGMYDAAVSALNNYKLQARLLEAQISREWGGLQWK